MSTSVSGYYIRLPQRSHSVHHPSCCTVDCDLSSVHFYNVRSLVQWLTVASITGKENTILAFEIDSRLKHCICFHHYDRDNQIANCHFGSNPRILDTCCNGGFPSMSVHRKASPDMLPCPQSTSLRQKLPVTLWDPALCEFLQIQVNSFGTPISDARRSPFRNLQAASNGR